MYAMPDESLFITETRKEVLSGTYEGSDSVRRTHESRIRRQSRAALDDLILVAASPLIDNAAVFEPEKVYRLLRVLTSGRGGLTGEEAPTEAKAWSPDEDYQRRIFEVLSRAQHEYHTQGVYDGE